MNWKSPRKAESHNLVQSQIWITFAGSDSSQFTMIVTTLNAMNAYRNESHHEEDVTADPKINATEDGAETCQGDGIICEDGFR